MLDSGLVFTGSERAHCRSRPDPYASLGGLFAAKEAFVKAVSALGGAPAYTFPDIRVVHGPAGQPRIEPDGEIGRWCARRRLTVELSISHTGDLAGAVVVLLACADEDSLCRSPVEPHRAEPQGSGAVSAVDLLELVEHRCEVALRPNDFDWAGHLNNSVYPQLLETGRWEWGLANGVDVRNSHLVAVVVQLHLDYLQPVLWDPVGRVNVRTDVVEQSPYSFTLAQDVEQVDGTVVARGRVKLSLVDRDTQQIHRANRRSLFGVRAGAA
ncbi:4'-phosphopantetheinyl transferase superfamily protein [Streptacidiphilus sp. PB12-B1b]|uniref:thioesterase family protein n=1 Tax=Streptacidiphilus sp. PB12-B1b TaxID=2705012 RepID=UPI0015F7DC29|nr:thioesterase family protein [Streptacidiphilus sp. PB12-B1b]QMU75744.1 4'-phosphopantetheinyl transferase superfamily protein [Streptacidiphilus sp. PB12-B1b]